MTNPKKRIVAHVNISGDSCLLVYHWSAEVGEVSCTHPHGFSTLRAVKQSARRWCSRLGLEVRICDEDLLQWMSR